MAVDGDGGTMVELSVRANDDEDLTLPADRYRSTRNEGRKNGSKRCLSLIPAGPSRI